MRFYISSQDEVSSFLRPLNSDVVEEITIPCLSLAGLLATLQLPRVDLLKVDIEGAEVELFDSCPDETLKRIPQVTVEFHDFNGVIASRDANRIVNRMRSLNFGVIKMWKRSHGDTLFVNRELAVFDTIDYLWSCWAVRHWWWTRRFLRRQFGASAALSR